MDGLDLPSRVTVEEGGRAEVHLPSYLGSGNLWSAVCDEAPQVASVVVQRRTAPQPDSKDAGTAPPPPQVLAEEFATVTGHRPGIARWRLVLARSWAPEPPTAVHHLVVEVI